MTSSIFGAEQRISEPLTALAVLTRRHTGKKTRATLFQKVVLLSQSMKSTIAQWFNVYSTADRKVTRNTVFLFMCSIGLLPEQMVHHHRSHIHTFVFTKKNSATTESSYRPRITEAGNPQ